MRNVPSSLGAFEHLVPVAGDVLGGSSGTALLEEVWHWRWPLRYQIVKPGRCVSASFYNTFWKTDAISGEDRTPSSSFNILLYSGRPPWTHADL